MTMGEHLVDLLKDFATTRVRPDGSSYLGLSLADARSVAAHTSLSLMQVETAAMANGILPERYSRNQKSLSCADQLRLLQSHVAIIGLGGLGGAVSEILARLGVGRLTLVDGDVFDESNLNRQLLSSPKQIGEKKVVVAAARMREINPAVAMQTIDAFFDADNGSTILAGAQLAVDCLDTIPARFVVQEACRKAGIPMISAAIAGSNGQAMTIFPDDPGLQLIYGAPEKTAQKGIEVELGTLPFVAMYMAAVQSAEVTNLLLGRHPELRHRLFLADVSEHTSELLTLSGEPEDSVKPK